MAKGPTTEDAWRLLLGQKPPSYSPSNPAPYGKGAGVLTIAQGGGVNIAKNAGVFHGDDPGGNPNPVSQADIDRRNAANAAAAAQAKANREGKSRSDRENKETRELADAQRKLIDAFGKQRDTKLGNIQQAMKDADAMLLKNYGISLSGLMDNLADNDKAEGQANFANISNAVREVGEVLAEGFANGAGESDIVKAMTGALRNLTANQNESYRGFYDSLGSANRGILGLGTDVATSRVNVHNQAESDIESTDANYSNQTADAWTNIWNIERSNPNKVTTDSQNAYTIGYGNAAEEAAAATARTYQRKAAPASLQEWEGKAGKQERALTHNKAGTINLGAAQKKPEGATLRKW